MKYCIVLGTRPEIIKMSPLVRLIHRTGLDYYMIHTGQHYSYDMDRIFFNELQLPSPKYNLNVGSGEHGAQTGKMLAGIEGILMADRPDIVFVQGDTNTVLAGALAAVKLHVPVGHVEAGLRSCDRNMPEEINRIATDHISDLLFAPTNDARQHLLREGLPDDRISVTGNTIVDAVYENLKIAANTKVPGELGLESRSYILSTLHRQENVDDRGRLAEIFEGLESVARELSLPVILPIHPRTKKMLGQFSVAVPSSVRLIEPLGFMAFLKAEAGARLVLTDSGGVQEECCILGVPCVTLRDSTERWETLDIKANVLAGHSSARILAAAKEMTARKARWENPYGDGHASERILAISDEFLARKK